MICGLAPGRFRVSFLMQMLGSDPLIQAVLGIDCFELHHLSPFFARLGDKTRPPRSHRLQEIDRAEKAICPWLRH